MYKITQQRDFSGTLTDRYSVSCYFFDDNSYSNIEIWQANNIRATDLAVLLHFPEGEQFDSEDVFVILNSGNGPVILTSGDQAIDLPVRKEVKLKEPANGPDKEREDKTVLQRKRATRVPRAKSGGH